MNPRGVIGLSLALIALAVTMPAHAWQEAHEVDQEVHVHVDASGSASIEDKVRWRVVRGPLKFIDLTNIDVQRAVESSVAVSTEDGRDLTAHLARQDDRTLRILIDEPRPPMHGALIFNVRWRVDLTASRALVRDGATYRLSWSAPAAADGLDGARTEFDFPAAPDPPQPIVAETGAIDDGAVASLLREPGRDVLDLVRPHVARGESAAWTVRVDPRALSSGALPQRGAPTESRWLREPDRLGGLAIVAGLAALAVAFGVLVATKTRAFACACSARGVGARTLLPLSDVTRAVLAGAALAVGVALQALDRPTVGGLCVALAALGAALRSPATRPLVRGPGRWLALRPSEAFATDGARGHWLDVGSGPGQLTLVVGLALVTALAKIASYFAPHGAWLVAMDCTAALPLLLTGSASQLPPTGCGAGGRWFARAFRRLRATGGLRVVPWGRLALDGSIDEVRILVLPRAALPGLVGVEIGLAWNRTPVGWASVPELLVRVLDASAAAAKLSQLTVHLKAALVVGRRPDERVARLSPRVPTVANAVALARVLGGEFTDRRTAAAGLARDGGERRGSPALRADVLEPRVSVYGA
jgi:hypothetical protein